MSSLITGKDKLGFKIQNLYENSGMNIKYVSLIVSYVPNLLHLKRRSGFANTCIFFHIAEILQV